jgi:hypothetical protein
VRPFTWILIQVCRFRQLLPSLAYAALAYSEDHLSAETAPSPMATPKLENYLRAYRKKSGLTQRGLAFLLGWQNGGQVSRYERRRVCHRSKPRLRGKRYSAFR